MENPDPKVGFYYAEAKREAIKYRERRRWIFLALLVPPTVFFYFATSEVPAGIGDKRMLSDFQLVAAFFFAFFGANVCYTFAYAVEFCFFGGPRYSGYLNSGRNLLFVVGCVFGIILAAGAARGIAFAEYPLAYP